MSPIARRAPTSHPKKDFDDRHLWIRTVLTRTGLDRGHRAGDRIEPVDIQQEMQRSYIDYAMSVIVGRALPEVGTGSSRCTGACCTACTTPASGPTAATSSARASSAT